MSIWTFFCYDDGKESTIWQRWYDGVDDVARASHDVALDYLEVRERVQWSKPHFGTLNPKKKIYEIRVTGKIQWRLIGYFGTGRQFTIVLSCNHKGKIYDPPGSKETAAKRKSDVESGKRNRKQSVRPTVKN